MKDYEKWDIFALVVTFIVVIFAGAVCISVIIIQANSMAVQRYTLQCTSSNLTATAKGMTWFDSSSNTIEWNLRYTNTGDNVLAVYINGPTPVGLTTGDLFIALCGSPSDLACDVSIAGLLHQKIYTSQNTGLGPQITTIRDFPILYYYQIIFDTTTMICPLGISAGW
jgi:hypothetical protein